MKIADKYILRQLIVGFTLILISLTLLVWLTQSLRMIDMIVSHGASVGVFLQMTLLALPNFIQILMPLAFFAVILFVFIRMQSDKELMVLKAVGMSPKQLIAPVMKMGSVLVVIGYFLSLWVIPASIHQMREMKWKIQNNLSSVLLQEGQFNLPKKGMMLYVRERLPGGGTKGILVYEYKEGKKSVLTADSGKIYQTSEGFDVLLEQGVHQEYNPETQKFSVLKFDKLPVNINEQGKEKSNRSQKVNELPLMTLWKTTPQKAPSLPMWRKYKVEIFKRLTQPLYNIVFALLALVGVLTGYYNRRGQSGRINAVILGALLLQTFALAFENASGKNLWCLILMMANLLVPACLIGRVFKKEMGALFKKIGVFFGVLCLTAQAQAFTEVDTTMVSSETPIDFASDKVSYNHEKQIMTASGNVVLNQNGVIFKTEKIHYNQEKDLVHIPGMATMILPDGNTSKLSNVEIYPKKNEIMTGATQLDFTDGTHLKAEHVLRQGNTKDNVLKDAHYIACETCENSAPLWQLHATTVEQNENNHLMRFWNTFLEVKDIPVFYFPYFQMPDPSVKRKTGFLLPSVGSDSTIDRYIKLPYFVDIAPNQNLTLTPVISFTQKPLGILDYQGRFTKGELNFNGSLTQDEDGKNQGHIQADFTYDLNKEWRLSGQFDRTISDTYFRRYSVLDIDDSQSYLTSDLKAEYYGNRLQGKADFYHFQSLQEGVNSDDIPVILPTFQASYTSLPVTENGGTFYTQVDGAFINDRTDFKSNRLSLEEGFRLPFKTNFGLVSEWTTSVRMDGYSLNLGKERADLYGQKEGNYWAHRLLPQSILKMSYPLIHYGSSVTQILEPIVMMIVAPNGSNPDDIPNVDSTVFDFNDTNLFSTNRYAGYDRVESGSRMNYGLQWSFYPKSDAPSIQFLFGQSYRLRDGEDLSDPMGYKNHFSSYVGRLKLDYKFLTMMYRFRLEEGSFKAQKNDVVLEVGNRPLRVGVDYLFQDDYAIGNQKFDEQKEVTFYAKSQLTKDWSLTGRYRYNLEKTDKGPLETSLNLRYDNECAAVEFSGRKSYTEDRNYHGNTAISVRLYLKTLG